MTIPSGNPAWTRTSSVDTYGGTSGLRDYAGFGPVNPKTDISAAQYLRLAADVASLARVAPFAVLTVRCNDTAPAAPTVLSIQQMTNVSLSGYAGATPSDASFPTLSRVADGSVQITWPATVLDEFGTEAAVNLKHIHVTVIGGNETSLALINLFNATGMQVSVFEGGSEAADATFSIEVS